MKTKRLPALPRISSLSGALALSGFLLSPPAGAKTPDALSLVPADAATVGVIRLSDLRSSPFSRRLFDETDHLSADGDAARFMREAGLDPRQDVDRVTASLTLSPDAKSSRSLVIFEGRFDPERLASAVARRGGARETTRGGDYYRLAESGSESKGECDREPGAVAFVDSHLVLAGSEKAVVAALAGLAAGGTRFASGAGLGRELRRVDPNATAWLLVDVGKARRARREGAAGGPAAGVVSALQSVSLLTMQANVTGDALELKATGLSADEETRGLLEDSLRGLTAAWRLAAQEKSPELVSAIRGFRVTRDDEGVTIAGRLPGELIRTLTARRAR